MNKKAIISTVIAACLTLSTSAFAQNHGNGNDNDRGRGEHAQGNDHSDRDNYRGNARNDRENYQARDNDHRGGARGAGPRHDLRKGGRLAHEYRGNQYVVNDWRGHRLSAPPRGSHWVQTGNDYVLVGIVSGIIAQVLLTN